jgi:hypothetical protein
MYEQKDGIDHPMQGDIVDSLPVYRATSGGVKEAGCHPAMLLEHTCDMSVDDGVPRTESYVYAPLFPFDSISEFMPSAALKNNLITHKIHLGVVPRLGERFIVDLNMTCNADAQSFHEALDDGTITRAASLSNNGFFFILAKISAHFLRASKELDHPER